MTLSETYESLKKKIEKGLQLEDYLESLKNPIIHLPAYKFFKELENLREP